jgi:saxitoxin biosynthesis operon SxtJ-like protein
MAREVPARLTPEAGRKFGTTVGGAMLVLAALLFWRGKAAAWVVAALGLVLVVAGLIVPTRLGPVERAWTALSHAISKVTTPIIMGVLYFVVLTPAGLVVRMLGRDPLARSRTAPSLWVRREPGARRGDLDRQF